jgi:hypothetical protein
MTTAAMMMRPRWGLRLNSRYPAPRCGKVVYTGDLNTAAIAQSAPTALNLSMT